MKPTIFIAGPMLGMENKQAYRKKIEKVCSRLGYDTIDPWSRERALYKGNEQCWWNEIPASDFVQRDLDDATKCDAMVVYLPRLSAGACMELFYAKQKNKKIIVISKMKCLSPWIAVHSDVIIKNISDLEMALKKLFS
jgi:hypothetical protein